MNDETIVQNGAADTARDTKHHTSRPSVGKIARLPKNIREELNGRLDNGQPASEILPWVNGLPATIKVLAKHFGGVPISEKNLSEWRHNGYQRWLEKQESVAELKMLAEDAKDFSEATGGTLARGAASIAAAKILRLLQTIPPEQGSIDELTKISYAITALLNAEQSQVRLEYEKTRVFQGNERLVLSWDKFLRSRVETAQRVLDDAIAKDIQATDIDNGEKIELLGHHLFGKKWQGREVGKKEDKKEPEGNTREDDFRADQQVRPTTVQGHSTEVKETDATPEQHMNRHSLCELEGRAHACVPTENASKGKGREDKGGDFPIAATEEEERGATDKVDGRTIESDFRADQQVRPTMTPGNSTAATVSRAGEKAEPEKTDATPEQHMNRHSLCELEGRIPTTVQGNNTPSNPKQKAPELSPYEKAILEGQTPLAALYAQFAPDPNAQPKPQEDPSVPKPSAWDAFSEPVRVSPFAFRPGPMRPAPGFNTLG